MDLLLKFRDFMDAWGIMHSDDNNPEIDEEEYVVVNAQNLARLRYETIRCAEEVHREAEKAQQQFQAIWEGIQSAFTWCSAPTVSIEEELR